jgi:hypothetical protein
MQTRTQNLKYDGQSEHSWNSLTSADLFYREFGAPGQNVAGRFYMKVLQILLDAVRENWRDHCDNAPSHTAQRLLCSNSCPHPTNKLSESRSKSLLLILNSPMSL